MAVKTQFIMRKIVLSTILLLSNAALSQPKEFGTEFGLVWYHGLESSNRFSKLPIKRKVGFSFALYPRRFLDKNTTWRFGFKVSLNRAEDDGHVPTNPPFFTNEEEKHSMGSFLLSFQRKFYQQEHAFALLGLAPGLSFFSSKPREGPTYRDGFFYNFPEIRIILRPEISLYA